MELYHLLNRGVDKREIFMDKHDYWRFVHGLWEFNFDRPASHLDRKAKTSGLESGMSDFVSQTLWPRPSKKLVNIHAWCLMKNHYHLLVSEREENGVTKFIRKLNIGHAKFINEKYNRTGALFQGRTKKILIEHDAHFLHILNYIHLNPLDYFDGAQLWREGNINNIDQALAYLAKYRWSSYLDYAGTNNIPSIITKDLFDGVFQNYLESLRNYLNNYQDDNLVEFEPITLEG